MSRVVVNEIEAKVGNDITFNDTVKIDTIKGKTTAGSITVQGEGTATTNLQQGLAKSWVNFNGTGTIATRDSFNHTSLTDEGTGDYTVTFTSAMTDTNYCTNFTGDNNSKNQSARVPTIYSLGTTSSKRVSVYNAAASAYQDTAINNISVQGDLA